MTTQLLLDYGMTVTVWAASLVIFLASPMLADEIAESIRRKGGNFKHGADPHRERLMRFGIRNFFIAIAAVVIPALIFYLSLVYPYLYFLFDGIALTDQGQPVTRLTVGLYVLEQTLLGVSGDILEVFEFQITNVEPAATRIERISSIYRLYASVFGATAFFAFAYVLIDRILIKMTLWPGPKGDPIRVNLSGLSRGYDAVDNQEFEQSESDSIH